MTEPWSQRTIATASLAVTVVIVVVMAVWGYNAFTAPIDDDPADSTSDSTDEVTCAPGEEQRIVETLRSGQVVVSVYNAGKRTGRAVDTLDALEARRFQPGATGNAADSGVEFVEIHVKESDRTKAELVALSFGKTATIVIEDEKDLKGPGVNVIIGDDFRKLKTAAPRTIKLPEPVITCE